MLNVSCQVKLKSKKIEFICKKYDTMSLMKSECFVGLDQYLRSEKAAQNAPLLSRSASFVGLEQYTKNEKATLNVPSLSRMSCFVGLEQYVKIESATLNVAPLLKSKKFIGMKQYKEAIKDTINVSINLSPNLKRKLEELNQLPIAKRQKKVNRENQDPSVRAARNGKNERADISPLDISFIEDDETVGETSGSSQLFNGSRLTKRSTNVYLQKVKMQKSGTKKVHRRVKTEGKVENSTSSKDNSSVGLNDNHENAGKTNDPNATNADNQPKTEAERLQAEHDFARPNLVSANADNQRETQAERLQAGNDAAKPNLVGAKNFNFNLQSAEEQTRIMLLKSEKVRAKTPRERLIRMNKAIQEWNDYFGTNFSIPLN